MEPASSEDGVQVLRTLRRREPGPGQTPRSSSLVENLNSRLRTCFTLCRHLGGSYLDLLRFFLNHRRLMRTRCAERQGKSPRELMTG